MTAQSLTPILYARDFAAAMAEFEGRLGFRKLWDWGTPPTFGAVGLDKIEIFLCEGCQGAPGTWMSIFVDDVDELHDQFVASGAKVLVPPQNEPWGMREMHVETVDGHVLRFGHGIPCAPPMTIERRPPDARVESRLASVLEDLAASQSRTVGQLLEEIVLHSFERMESNDGCNCTPAPYTARTFRLIAELKQKHGALFDVHANYGFTERSS